MLATLTPSAVNMRCTPMDKSNTYSFKQIPRIANSGFIVVELQKSHASPIPMSSSVSNTSHAHACQGVGGTGDGRSYIVARPFDPTLGRLSYMMQPNTRRHEKVYVLHSRHAAIISAWRESGKSVTQLCAIEQCKPRVVVICMNTQH